MKLNRKILHIDIETTGMNPYVHGVHQIGGVVDIDGEIKEEFQFFVKPHPLAAIEEESLAISGTTKEGLRKYPEMHHVHIEIMELLSKYVNPNTPQDCFVISGFNLMYFDLRFIERWFAQNGDKRFHGYFYKGPIDTFSMASEYLLSMRDAFGRFGMEQVAESLGIYYDKSKLHNALYDAQLSYKIFYEIRKKR